MATNRFDQRHGFIKGKSFTMVNHFSDKGNGLDPVPVDSQKNIWWNVPVKIVSRRAAESGEDGKNRERGRQAPTLGSAEQPEPELQLDRRPGAQRCDIGGDQVTKTELRQYTPFFHDSRTKRHSRQK